MRETDPFERLFSQLPEIHAPYGFSQRLCERLIRADMEPTSPRYDVFRISGMICIASAFTMFFALRLPLSSIIPQASSLFEALKGVLP